METQVVKANPDEVERIKRFFIRMSLIAHSQGEFDVNEHFNDSDHDYDFMMQFQKDGVFNFKEFISTSINGIGTGFERVINGYEELVEKYCDPESLVLEEFEIEPVFDGTIGKKGDDFFAEHKVFLFNEKEKLAIQKATIDLNERWCIINHNGTEISMSIDNFFSLSKLFSQSLNFALITKMHENRSSDKR